ncbi:hypothetical protein Golax_008914, partial [Gossypium laxum]|nr:hypothetical protein [Gossypium laxum]
MGKTGDLKMLIKDGTVVEDETMSCGGCDIEFKRKATRDHNRRSRHDVEQIGEKISDSSSLLDFVIIEEIRRPTAGPPITLSATGLASLALLSTRELRVLDLSNMGLIGTIPPQLGNLSFLVSRYLSHNNFQGHFPWELGRLSHLKLIDLSFNFLNGKIPSWFGRLDKVLHLNLRNNNLKGVIPPSIANLDLNFNLIHGNIPHEISKFLNLRILRLACNQLSGSIPAVIYNISSLRMISVPHNHLSGSLQKDIGNLTELKKLLLYDNNLEGEIPQDIRNLQKLEIFDVSMNNLSGDPDIGPLGEDDGKFVYLVDYSASKSKPQPPKVQNQPPTNPPQPHKKDP